MAKRCDDDYKKVSCKGAGKSSGKKGADEEPKVRKLILGGSCFGFFVFYFDSTFKDQPDVRDLWSGVLVSYAMLI